MTVPIETLAGDEALAFRAAIKPHMLAILDEENLVPAPDISEQLAAVEGTLDAKVALAGNFANAVGDVDIPGAEPGQRSALYFSILSGNIANASTNFDVPGFAPGMRGSQYWSIVSGANADRSEAARDASALYKADAETAQTGAQSDAAATAADRAAVAADKSQVANDKAYVIATAANLLPYSAIPQTQLYDAGGSLIINGTGGSLTNSDNNIAISPKSATGMEALYMADATNTRKAIGIGPYAMQYFNGYDSLGIGWRALFYSAGRNSVALGVHAGEATAYSARDVNGFGVRASGSITFTALPVDGDTVTLNGAVFTARNAAATASEFTIAGTISGTIDNLLTKVVGSASGALRGYLFRKSAAGTALEILAMGAGTWGNGFTLAVAGAGLARSGATLLGGTLLKNDGNQDNYTGLVAIGIGAVKRFDQVFGRAPHGVIFVSGQASVGATITLGLGLTVSTAAATVKRFTCVAAGATGLQFNQGADAASQIANIISALQTYVAANPTHTQMTSVEFYASQRGIEVVHKTASSAGNLYRTEATGTGLSAQSPFLHGGYSSAKTPPIGVGMNSEAGFGANLVMVGKSAGRTAQGRAGVFIGENSGNTQIGENNVYLNGSGQNVIGSNNFLLGPSLGGATTQAYFYIQSVSASGLITLTQPLTDAQCVIGRRLTFSQRNQVLSTNLLKQNGVNIANPTLQCIIVSPTLLQIIDYTDGAGPAGDAVFSTSGPASDIELAPVYATINGATSWGDAPESSTAHVGVNRQDRATIRAQRLELPNGRWQVAAPTAGAGHATGYIQFATANGNFAADETVTINGTVFTAKAAATLAVPGTTMIRWFRIGADMHESLMNLIACIRNSDDDSASARAVRIATYWIAGQTGSGWRLHARITGRLVTGNTFTLATSKAGATVVAPSGGTTGILPLAAAVGNPGVADGERRQLTLGGQPVDAIYNAALDDYLTSYFGS